MRLHAPGAPVTSPPCSGFGAVNWGTMGTIAASWVISPLLGGAIVTESVFNLPGLGRAIFDAVRAQQGPVVVGIVTLMVFFYIFFNLLADVLYAVIDPRIRYD